MRHLPAAVGLLAAGAVTGVAAVGLHELWWGFVLVVAAGLAAVVALPPGWWSRLAFVAGFAALVGWLAVPRSEGDYLISTDWQGYGLLAFGFVLLVGALATLPRRVT